MDNKSEIIKLLFCKVPAEKILSALNTTTVLASKSREFNYNNIPLDETEKYMRAYMPHFSGDEIQHAVKTVRGKSEVELPLSHAADGLNIFALVLYFANSVLIMRNGRITCRYEKLFKWHLLSHDVDEDTFTTAFAAYHDIEFDYLRKYFGWSNIIKSDNVRLKNVLNQGIAENHFHLKGSAPCFQLNWIYLMNKALNTTIVHKNRIRKELDKWDKEPLSPSLHIDTSKKSDFYTLILKAAIIRFFLFCEMNKGLGLFLPCISVDWKDVSRYLELEEFKNVTINVKICNAYVGYKNAGSFDADILRIDLIYRKDFLDGLETIAPPLGKALIELITQLFCGCDIQRFPDSNPKIYIKDFFNILRNESCSLRLNILKNLVTPQTYLYLSETYQKAFVVELLDNDNSEDPTFLTYIEEIDSFIVGIRDTISDMDKLVDYALLEKDGGSKSSENIWFHGERKLMYDVYKSLFSKKLSDPILGNLFFAYLQIKLKFRAELIQLNSHIGFYNFARYQDRKEAFIDWDKHYSRAVIDIAISESTKEQSIVSIEARITPLETSIKIHKRIKEYDKIISGAPKGNDAHDKRVFYMFSFPKEKEKDRSNEDYLAIPYRHADYRDKLDKLAKAIVGFSPTFDYLKSHATNISGILK